MSKHLVVVGGQSAIGQATAKKWLENGHRVTLIARTPISDPTFKHSQSIAVDINRDEFPSEEIEGEVDNILYCPGSIHLKPFRSLKPEQFRIDYEINVVGAVKSLQGLWPKMRNGEGDKSVVLFSSVAAQLGMPFHTSIAAAKGAIEAFIKSLAAEWAPKIRVNGIAPSLTDTPLAARLISNEQKRDASAARHPLQRIGTPDDMAHLAYFLLSEESSWITGQIIHADGGLSKVKTN